MGVLPRPGLLRMQQLGLVGGSAMEGLLVLARRVLPGSTCRALHSLDAVCLIHLLRVGRQRGVVGGLHAAQLEALPGLLCGATCKGSLLSEAVPYGVAAPEGLSSKVVHLV